MSTVRFTEVINNKFMIIHITLDQCYDDDWGEINKKVMSTSSIAQFQHYIKQIPITSYCHWVDTMFATAWALTFDELTLMVFGLHN